MKLLGLYKVALTHAVIEPGKTICGRKVEVRKDSLPHSGRSHVNCPKCLNGIPDDYA